MGLERADNAALRPEAVAFFGIAPEGPVTTLNCEAWGELTLVPNGTEFSGTATQSSSCVTKGGIPFDPSGAFGPGWDLVAGRIAGRSISFFGDLGTTYVATHRVGGRTHGRPAGACDLPGGNAESDRHSSVSE